MYRKLYLETMIEQFYEKIINVNYLKSLTTREERSNNLKARSGYFQDINPQSGPANAILLIPKRSTAFCSRDFIVFSVMN